MRRVKRMLYLQTWHTAIPTTTMKSTGNKSAKRAAGKYACSGLSWSTNGRTCAHGPRTHGTRAHARQSRARTHKSMQPRSHAATQPTGTRARRRKGTQACTGQPDTSQAILTTQEIHSRGTWWDTISTPRAENNGDRCRITHECSERERGEA